MIVWVGIVVPMIVLAVGHGRPWSLAVAVPIFVFFPLAWFGLVWWRSRREVLIDVAGGGLTINERSGRIFALVDAKLGPWTTQGVALHLNSGPHRFVLGGRDRRLAPTTRLDAPAVQAVDAYLGPTEFNQLLAVGGSGGGSDMREPAPGEPTRCLLFPNPYLTEQLGAFAFWKKIRHQRSLFRPALTVDVEAAAVRISGMNGETPSVVVTRSQVAAAPGIFQLDSVTSGDGATHNYPATTGMLVNIPGLPPLAIGCLDLEGAQFRFSWRGDVARPMGRPDHVVSGADWLVLADSLGLTSYVDDLRQPSGSAAPQTLNPLSDNYFRGIS